MADPVPKESEGASNDSAVTETLNQKSADKDKNGGRKLPSSPKSILLVVSALMSMFLVALDRTVVSTATPSITNEFNSLPDVGWYGAAYLMTNGAFQLLFGSLYTFYDVRTVYVVSIVLFEIGSAICGSAPKSSIFIFGRALSGVGAAGIQAGCMVSIAYCIPLAQRPRVIGALGGIFGVGVVLGPLVGGAFTSTVSWRWCFYVNLPIGGVSMIITSLFIKIPKQELAKLPPWEKIRKLDIAGTFCFVPGIICLVLALQLGGQQYPWNSGRVIALLVAMAILLIAFVVIQVLFQETAMVPGRIFKSRSVCAALWATFFLGAGVYTEVYYLSLWFQSIKGNSALMAGVHLLPSVLTNLIFSFVFGFIVGKIGYYTPFGIAGASLLTVSAGLYTLLEVNTGKGEWIGFQIVYGVGQGLLFQTPQLAMHTTLPKKDIPKGMALNFFCQLIGGALALPVANTVLVNTFIDKLSGVPNLDTSLIAHGGATALLNEAPANLRPIVLQAFNGAIKDAFRVALAFIAMTVLGTVCLEWKSTRTAKPDQTGSNKTGNAEKENNLESGKTEDASGKNSTEKVNDGEKSS